MVINESRWDIKQMKSDTIWNKNSKINRNTYTTPSFEIVFFDCIDSVQVWHWFLIQLICSDTLNHVDNNELACCFYVRRNKFWTFRRKKIALLFRPNIGAVRTVPKNSIFLVRFSLPAIRLNNIYANKEEISFFFSVHINWCEVDNRIVFRGSNGSKEMPLLCAFEMRPFHISHIKCE